MADALALSWSGGKDSALALWTLRRQGTPPDLLLTTFDEQSGTVPHHGIALELVREQAAAAGLPLVPIAIPPAAANETYEDRLRTAFSTPPLDGVGAVAFGDLFLADLRRYREERLAEAGVRAVFPLWGATRARSPASSSPRGSAPRWCRSTASRLAPSSSGASSTTRCSTRSRPASIRAARTASTTRSCTTARSTTARSLAPSRTLMPMVSRTRA